MLSNWAAACLELESFHEALAAAAASLRIWVDPKSIFRLSRALVQLNEFETARGILSTFPGSANAIDDLMLTLSRYTKALKSDDNGAALINFSSAHEETHPLSTCKKYVEIGY